MRGSKFILILAGLLVMPATIWAQTRTASLAPEGEFHMARLIFTDGLGPRWQRPPRGIGGWWAIDYPDAEYHFTRGVRRLSRVDVAQNGRQLSIMEDEIFDYPWLFVQQVGQGNWNPNPQEAERFREYLLRGGFMVVDDFHGSREWDVFQRAMSRIFPNRPLVDISEDDEVFRLFYEMDKSIQIPGQRHLYWAGNGEIRAQLRGPQEWKGIYDDKGRLMVVANFNMDMGDSWEHADDPYYPEAMTRTGYHFGLNYLIYAMTH